MRRIVRRWVVGSLAGCLVVGGLLAGYTYWTLQRPLPPLMPAIASHQITVRAPTKEIAWPNSGQAAIAMVGDGLVASHGPQTPAPTASTAKIITALTVLKQKPLAPGQPGPLVTMSVNDIALYNAYAAADGSVVRVQAGEQISEYQLLQAVLIPSANNLADSLAIWAFGSLDAYAAAANSYLASLGLNHTHVGKDASGLDPSTTSTAEDLVKLGSLVMQSPVLSGIVGQQTATGLPLVGTVKNVNFLLGTEGIVGIKTGNSDQAGGVFVSAARTTVNGQPVTIVTALVGAPSLFAAVQGSLPFIQSAKANFTTAKIVKAGSVVGNYHAPWGGSVPAVAAADLKLGAWAGSSVSATVALKPAAHTSGAQMVGIVSTLPSAISKQQSVPVKLQGTLPPPSIWWRLLHPFSK